MVFEKFKDQIQNAQNRRSEGKANHIYETYKNTVMPYGRHIFAKAYDMAKTTMCSYPQSDHVLPNWKFVMGCGDKFPCLNIPYQETYYQYSDTSPSIRFHIYHMIACCTKHGRLPLDDQKQTSNV